jgi:hypothetical protein
MYIHVPSWRPSIQISPTSSAKLPVKEQLAVKKIKTEAQTKVAIAKLNVQSRERVGKQNRAAKALTKPVSSKPPTTDPVTITRPSRRPPVNWHDEDDTRYVHDE